MVRNAASDLAAVRRPVPLEESTADVVEIDDVDARVDGRRATEMLLRLSPKLRETVFLRHLAGLSFREIAEVCGVPLFTAASRHRLAIRRLRKLMGVEDDR
jgi:DNA-directed RNA polymerase specialized sigma24 family protein